MLKVTRGKQRTPVRAVLYGTEGVGKSTLASQFPNPLILDTEDGTSHLDVARMSTPDWMTLEGALHDLVGDPQGFQTVVIDSADWMERGIVEAMLKKFGKRSIEDFGFGKGYVLLAEHFARVLGVADQLIGRGVNVVFVAHAKIQRTSPPDQDEGYDRYELKLTKHTAPLLREWSDLLLFCTFRTKLVEGADGRMKARGGKDRIMYASHSAAWDAKNRFGLPDEMPMEFASIATVFDRPAGQPAAVPAAVQSETKRVASEQLAAATTVKRVKELAAAIDKRLQEGKLADNDWADLQDDIDARLKAITAMVDSEAVNA